jgi:hypothetical protein
MAKTNKSNGKIVFIIIGIVVFLSIAIGGIIYAAINLTNSDYNTTDIYKGYKRGYCPIGQYEAWNGGAPTGDPQKDNTCLTKSAVDSREDLFKGGGALKPVIMLYSEKDTDFKITQGFGIKDGFIYPKYNFGNSGWQGKVLGGDNGHLLVDSKKYDYLFWEGKTGKEYDLSRGNVVPKEQTTEFLEKALEAYGLNAREAGDFITFWAPKLMKNDYNQISFVNEEYAKAHPVEVSPKPDYEQRVFMVYKKANKDQKIEKQEFTKAESRHGFSLIEWGGEEIE